jgi:ABC-type sugar transport system permease subunit
MMITRATPRRRSPTLRERIDLIGGFRPYLLVLPTLLVILAIGVYPMLDAFLISVVDNPLVANPQFVQLENYMRVLDDPVFREAMYTTVIFTVCSVALELLLGLGVAVLLHKSFPGRGLVRASILVPWAFPTLVSAQMWLLMYNDQVGIVTSILQGLKLLAPGNSLLNTSQGVIIAALITDIWKTTPFVSLLLLAGLQVISAELYESASLDGSTRWQRFWYITFPLLRVQILITFLFRSLDAIRVFDLFYVFGTRTVPSMASYANIKMFAGTPGDFAPGVASSVIVFLFGLVISLIVVVLMQQALKRY